jgi:hypothetical protein
VKEISNAFDLYWNSRPTIAITDVAHQRPSEQELAAIRGGLRMVGGANINLRKKRPPERICIATQGRIAAREDRRTARKGARRVRRAARKIGLAKRILIRSAGI